MAVVLVGPGALALVGCGGNGQKPLDAAGRGGSIAGADGGAGTSGGGGAGTGGNASGGGGSAVAVAGAGGGPVAGAGGLIAGAAGGAVAGAAGTTSGPGGAAGSLNPGTREPRVLVVDPTTPRLAAYGRHGEIAHDYLAEIDFGSGFGWRNIWVDWHLLSWDGPVAGAPRLGSAPPGLSEPLRGSRIVLRAANTSTHKVKVKVLTVAGTVETTFTLDGDWDGFALSPARTYVYATTPLPATDAQTAALVRPSDGMILWQKVVSYALFARDDAHLIFTPEDPSQPPRIRDLGTGAEIGPALTQEPFKSESNIQIGLEAALPGRAVIKASGYLLQSRLLYQMDWAGTITRFGSATPKYTDEYLQAFDPAGQRVLWSRQTNGLDGMPAAYVGAYEMTFGATQVTTWNGFDAGCFGRTENTFKIAGDALQSCTCAGTCTTIATVPIVGPGWHAQLVTNPDRRNVVVVQSWAGNSQPTTTPDTRCYSASGQLLATIPYGTVELDPTGQIVLLRAAGTLLTNPGQSAIVDLATGEIHWLGRVSTAIVNE